MTNGGSHVVAISGGKDSTAMAIALRDLEPREYIYLCTPTGNELPELDAHWKNLESILGSPINRVSNRTLEWWIGEQRALPNFRMRWCTRILKIEPCQAFLLALPPPVVLYVGLRDDEPGRVGAQYSGMVTERYPLREWGWKKDDVVSFLRSKGIAVPTRTDCAWCYYQRIEDWWNLWKNNPESYQGGVDVEEMIGHTFRSAGRDSWPASLADLRSEFERGRTPRSVSFQLPLFDDEPPPCRVCSL